MRCAAFALAAMLLSGAANLRPCTSVVVGRKASADGCVLFGHNEDNAGLRVVNAWVVPRAASGRGARLPGGGRVPDAEASHALLWFQVNGEAFSDLYANEWGVTVASDACPSREDNPDLSDGGIGFDLRRLAAARSRTAAEAVRLAGDLLDRFGYASSGRTYVICDPKEGWILSVAAGKHWVARRVPDDAVAVLPNTYIVRGVDPADPENFMCSSGDVLDYARRRGWWSPESGPFDFTDAYRSRGPDWEALEKRRFDLRQWRGLSLLGGRPIPEAGAQSAGLPFCVKPARPVGVRDVMALLRDHLEGTRFEDRTRPNPHGGERKICWSTTILSVVARLDPSAPAPLAARLWTAFGRPDTAPYVPWHPSLLSVPEGYCRMPGVATPDSALARHFDSPAGTFERDPSSAFWAFKDLASVTADAYPERRPVVAAALSEFEDGLLSGQDAFEKGLEGLPENGVREALTRRTAGLAAEAAALARGLASKWNSGAAGQRPAGNESGVPCGSTESTSG